jgi:PBSX family phage terminase large subunit
MADIVYSYKVFNPLFWHLREAFSNVDIRYIINKGGSSSGKSVSACQTLLLSVLAGEGNVLVLRKIGASIKNTVYEEFKTQAKILRIFNFFIFIENSICCINGMKIDFSGLDNPEKIKSISNYKRILLEEASDFEYEDFVQVTFRLRGKEGLQIIMNFNPISEDLWIKTNLVDRQEWNDVDTHLYGKVKDAVTGRILPVEYSSIKRKRYNSSKEIFSPITGDKEVYNPDTVELHSTYLNNFWVVGSPDGLYGYYDKQTIANYEWYRSHDYNFYRIYALGEWGSIKTGGEFLHAFDVNLHVGSVKYDSTFPVFISVDDNLLPYISISFFQLKKEECQGMVIRRPSQFHEICAKDPFNSVTKASEMARSFLVSIGYKDVVYILGDATTQKGNTIDEAKQSFFDKFVEGISKSFVVREIIEKSNPSVSMTGEFINAILGNYYSDIFFAVDERCKNSVSDYNNAKKDVDGTILKLREKDKKTGQTFEKYGHLTDCLRYFMYAVFRKEYTDFSLRRKRSEVKEDDLIYYNMNAKIEGVRMCYIIPDSVGRCVVACFVLKNYVFLKEVLYSDRFDEQEVIDRVGEFSPDKVIIECGKQYSRFILCLREKYDTWVLKDNANIDDRINGNLLYIKEKVRFNPDESDEAYSSFIYDVLGYPSEEKSAVNALSAICSYVSRMKE